MINFLPKSPKSFSKEFQANSNRWNAYLKEYFSHTTNLSSDQQKLAVKAIITLMTNWRHRQQATYCTMESFLLPLITDFMVLELGFMEASCWIVSFNPELAKSNILSMFDYMDSLGMVADCIYLDKSENNWGISSLPCQHGL